MHKKLMVGDKAPDFSTYDMSGKSITLKSFSLPYTLIVFLRYSGCPWCNLALHRLSLEFPILQRNGCEVIAFVQSTPEKIKKNIYRRHKLAPPFPVIADPNREFYDLYGVVPTIKTLTYGVNNIPSWAHGAKDYGLTKIDGNYFIVPAFFVINAAGIIEFADYSASFYDHETFTPIYELLTFGTAST